MKKIIIQKNVFSCFSYFPFYFSGSSKWKRNCSISRMLFLCLSSSLVCQLINWWFANPFTSLRQRNWIYRYFNRLTRFISLVQIAEFDCHFVQFGQVTLVKLAFDGRERKERVRSEISWNSENAWTLWASKWQKYLDFTATRLKMSIFIDILGIVLTEVRETEKHSKSDDVDFTLQTWTEKARTNK